MKSNMSIKQYFNNLLTEDKEGKNINAARKYLKAKGYSLEESQKILDGIRSSIPNSRIADCKFLLGVTRMYLKGELKDGASIFRLNRVLPYIGSDAHVNEYQHDLNGMSLEELVERFSGVVQQDAERSRAESNATKRVKHDDYTIVRIPSFEDAERYSRYTTWCVTNSANMYNQYTNDGLGLFYFCLKNGFKNVPKIEGKNCPLDEYGLSMIAVSVTEDGEPNTITCRWNHDNGGNDSIIPKDKLEELLGVNFYETFKPYSDEEIAQKKEALMYPFREAKKKLELGESPISVFDLVYSESEGYSKVVLGGKCSFIDSNNKLIGNGGVWFDDADVFNEGLAEVERAHKCSFINKHGELIGNGNLWFDFAFRFKNGFSSVCLNGKCAFIDCDGNIVGGKNMWFDAGRAFISGFAGVKINDKGWTFMNTKGDLIGNGNLWFEDIRSFRNGLGSVKINGIWYKLDKNCNFYAYHTHQPIPNPLKESKRNKKTIIVSESAFSRGLLTEDKEGKNINYARKYLKEKGYSLEKAQEILDAIRSDMHNARIADCKFLLGIARLFLNGELKDGTSIFNLNRILPYIGSDAHVNEYNRDLNGLSLVELVDRFGGVADQDAERSRADSYAKEHVRNNDYTIVRVTSFEEAEKYKRYTSWCVTHSKDMYQKYTNDGLGLFYFCLKDEFERISKRKGKNCPLDKYGLSMIAVSVTEYGEPNTITCRWNHANGGNDKIMTKDELENLLGVNFYETFKPYSKEEIMRPFREAKKKLDQGAYPEAVFHWVCDIDEGFLTVELNKKYSLVNTNSNQLIGNGELWFDWVCQFHGFAKVKLNNKWSIINSKGELINNGNAWFDKIGNFNGGLASVKLNNKGYSFINTKGELIGDGKIWVDNVMHYEDGIAIVEVKGEKYKMDRYGNFYSVKTNRQIPNPIK